MPKRSFRIEDDLFTAPIGPTFSKASTGITRKVATAQAKPPAKPSNRPKTPSLFSRARMAVPTTADSRAHSKMTLRRPQARASDPPIVGVRPSMRSVAAKTSATLKITVEAVATTEPQARARRRVIPLCPSDTAIGTETARNTMTAVMVAMTGSQII